MGRQQKLPETRPSMKWLWIALTARKGAEGMLRENMGRGRSGAVWESLFDEVTFMLRSPAWGWGRAKYYRQHKEHEKGGHPNDSQKQVEIPQACCSTAIANMWHWLAHRERGKSSGNLSWQCLLFARLYARDFVPAALFPYFLLFLMPSRSCLTWMPLAKWGSSSGSRETKGKVAIVTEATENSISSSPEYLWQGEAVETPIATQLPRVLLALGPVCQSSPFQQFLGRSYLVLSSRA